jgi:hypothetical protein
LVLHNVKRVLTVCTLSWSLCCAGSILAALLIGRPTLRQDVIFCVEFGVSIGTATGLIVAGCGNIAPGRSALKVVLIGASAATLFAAWWFYEMLEAWASV